MKKYLIMIMMIALLFVTAACSKTVPDDNGPEESIDYLVLVNKLNPLPSDWEDRLETVHFTNSLGDDVEVEKQAYDAYLLLKADLEKKDIHVDLDSARRSVAEQQKIMDDFTAEYGADYAAKYVAVPGYSEHHTGLALDLYLIIDGVDVYLNEDMVGYTDIWDTIHSIITDYGFILRYLPGKEHITGYNYEPWHIRYVGDKDIAKEIMDKGLTLEGYLGVVSETEPLLEYGNSELYSKEELDEMMNLIKCRFASFAGCELHSLRYAGDDAMSEEEEQALKDSYSESGYVKIVEFLTDFHSPKEIKEGYSWEADHEYEDYQWYLGQDEEGSWEIISWGY